MKHSTTASKRQQIEATARAREAAVAALLAQNKRGGRHRWTYTAIAAHLKIPKNAVAGLAYRAKRRQAKQQKAAA